MKKVFVFIMAVALVSIGNVSAQSKGKVAQNDFHIAPTPPKPTPLTIELENVMISSVKINEGANTVPVPNGRGTLKFVKRGIVINTVIYTDAAGKSTRLEPKNGATNGAPSPSCKCPLPDACFGSADKNVGMCMCKPCDLSNGGEGTYSIGLLLPAIQKTRN